MNKIAKSIVAMIVAAAGTLQMATLDGTMPTDVEWVWIATAAVMAWGLVWGVPNNHGPSRDMWHGEG